MNKNRNRHTGRINAAKEGILDKGKRKVVVGVEYASIPDPRNNNNGAMVKTGRLI